MKFYENPSNGIGIVPCGWTHMTMLLVTFRNFATAPENVSALCVCVYVRACVYNWQSCKEPTRLTLLVLRLNTATITGAPFPEFWIKTIQSDIKPVSSCYDSTCRNRAVDVVVTPAILSTFAQPPLSCPRLCRPSVGFSVSSPY
jgi:hypothetical protein